MEKEGNSHAEPLVSVVMATFNGARFVGAQLDSILNQSYPKLEVVIVDDHSTDNTFDILSDYARKDARIRLYRNDKNLGYVKNFERGLCLATGDFIAPSDQDDIWLPHKIEFLLQHIGDEAIAYGDSKLIDENGNYLGLRISDLKCLTTFENCLNYLIGNSAPGHGMLIRKEVIPAAIPLPTVGDARSLDWLCCNFRKPCKVCWRNACTLPATFEKCMRYGISEKRTERKTKPI